MAQTKKVIFSFGGGATSYLGAIEALNRYDNVEIVNCALVDDEPHIKPVIDAFEHDTGVKIKRISYHSQRYEQVQRAMFNALQGNQSPEQLRQDIKCIKDTVPPEWRWEEVSEPLYTVWTPFFVVGRIGSWRADPCSKWLKREVFRRYFVDTGATHIALGMTPDEIDRAMGVAKRYGAGNVLLPLDDVRYSEKLYVLSEFRRRAGFIPDAYEDGFTHNNCGLCVKAGHRETAIAMRERPTVFALWERLEQLHQATYQHTSTMLKRDVLQDGKRWTYSYSLSQLREDVMARDVGQLNMFDDLPSAPSCTACASVA